MSLREMLSDYWYAFQQELFPRLESELGPMGARYELFVAVLELVRVEALLPYFRGQAGRPEEDRAALARAFIAKAVFDVPTTRGPIERLEVDGRLCRLCGWSGAGRLPSEATFSRAFSEFAESGLASRLHETLIARTMDGHLVEHISRDATAIEAREKPAPKPKAAKPKRRRKRGRPRKGEEQAKEPSRLERQLTMSLPQMLADLPRACDVGAKRNATLPFRTAKDPATGGQGRSPQGKMRIAGAVELSPEGEPRRIRLAPIGDFSARSLRAFVAGTSAPGARVITDGWSGYCGLPDHDHQPKVVGATPAHLVLTWIHRVFSNLKRWALGTFHGLRRAHLRRYLDEFVFRWNRRRHTATAFDTLLGIGTRLRPADYRDIVGQHV